MEDARQRAPTGLEPAASRVTGRRSNQMKYQLVERRADPQTVQTQSVDRRVSYRMSRNDAPRLGRSQCKKTSGAFLGTASGVADFGFGLNFPNTAEFL
jgi:hypothetical protein